MSIINSKFSKVAREKEIKYKNKMLGNMKFIGNLLNYHILAAKILVVIVKSLMTDWTPITLECLCTLLTVVGEKRLSSRAENVVAGQETFWNGVFDMLKSISTAADVQPRIKFLILGVLDLKKNDWRKPL